VPSEHQIITIGTKLTHPDCWCYCPNCGKQYAIRTGNITVCSVCGEVVQIRPPIGIVVNMTYYRSKGDERNHELLLEVEYPGGSRLKDVYYHFNSVEELSKSCEKE